jgi:hypothetical protein
LLIYSSKILLHVGTLVPLMKIANKLS